MRRGVFVLAAVLALALGAKAQVQPAGDLFLGSPSPIFAAPNLMPAPQPEPLPPAEPASPAPQGVYGVFQNYNFQAGIGLAYTRFYEAPGFTDNMVGFNASVVYYPHADRLGVDGEFALVFGSLDHSNTTLSTAMVGPRFRFVEDRGIEFWIHGLGGLAHSTPQTPFGNMDAFGVEAGAGVDLNPRHKRFGYRVEGDVLTTFFFGTYQINPKISAGIFYKF
jgi:hypothetical protein